MVEYSNPTFQDLPGGRANRPFASNSGIFRLRQHATFFFFHKNVARCATFLWKKDGFFRPAGGESGWLSRQTPGLEPTA
jgi:hypothetical protein